MTSLRDQIEQSLDELPEARLREVLDFVEFLKLRVTSDERDEPLLALAGTLSGEMLTAEEIENELYGDQRTGDRM